MKARPSAKFNLFFSEMPLAGDGSVYFNLPRCKNGSAGLIALA